MNTIQKISLKFIENQSLCKLENNKLQSGVTAEWIKHFSGLPWLKLDLNVPYLDIDQEINQIKKYFVAHRETYDEHNGWNSFCIHGKSFDSTREDSFYNDNRPYRFTDEACDLMPKTVAFFKSFNNVDFLRIRVMELKPKGVISIHRDGEPPGSLDPINIAITQPNDCKFVMEKYGAVPFKTGDAFILNVSNKHAVYNNSDTTRYHIIMHYKPCTTIDNLILKSYNQLYDNLHN